MSDQYSKFIIKEYAHWVIHISEEQNYLGRCIVWCKRENALDLTEVTIEEREELFVALNELKAALTKAFNADWFNYAFLGNGVRHLHCHFIPRYEKKREFEGVTFEDKLWGHNYKTDRNFKISPEVLAAIQLKIKEAI